MKVTGRFAKWNLGRYARDSYDIIMISILTMLVRIETADLDEVLREVIIWCRTMKGNQVLIKALWGRGERIFLRDSPNLYVCLSITVRACKEYSVTSLMGECEFYFIYPKEVKQL